jgi:death-on-curing protein
MAAAYLFHLVSNHPFIDGNKRVALECSLVFLEINGVSVEASDDELVDLTLDAAKSESSKQRIADFLRLKAVN